MKQKVLKTDRPFVSPSEKMNRGPTYQEGVARWKMQVDDAQVPKPEGMECRGEVDSRGGEPPLEGLKAAEGHPISINDKSW